MAADLLDQVGLAKRQRHKPAELSGGEQQRVAIARAVVGHPSLVIADEPTGDLDAANAEAVIRLMKDLNQTLGITFVIATHNLSLSEAATCVFELHDGELKGG
jgi:lipoprotein-releasing system ATP-binding protein